MLALNKASAIGVVAIASLLGQVDSPGAQPSFVASIKPNNGDPGGYWTTPGRVLARNATARLLIAIAYGLQPFQISGGPGWVDSDRFDVEAKLDAQRAGSGHEALMMKMVLADRFRLQVHQETRESSVYALEIAARGPKMKPVSAQGSVNVREGILVSTGMPMGLVASLLGTRLGRTVIDRTNLEGRYAVDLRWAPGEGELPAEPGGTAPLPTSLVRPSLRRSKSNSDSSCYRRKARPAFL